MLYWLIYILLEGYIQGKLIKKGYKPIYLMVFLVRGIFSILQGGLILDVQYDTWQYPILLGFQICSFYIIFDPLLNLFRKEKWDYEGKTSGYLDKLPKIWYYSLKLVCLFGAIFLYIKGLQYWNY